MKKYTIETSYGEIIDKITILQIKLKKTQDEEQMGNILKEYNVLSKYLDKNNDEFNILFTSLSKINNKLWILEDLIRHKSRNNEFDKEYINYAENIHKTNDERYIVKCKLNKKYNSNIYEEKIYSKTSTIPSDVDTHTSQCKLTCNSETDYSLLLTSVKYYNQHDILKSREILEPLCLKYINVPTTVFKIDLFFSYQTCISYFGIKNKYEYILHEIMQNVNTLNLSITYFEYAKCNYGLMLLKNKQYLGNTQYIQYINKVTANNGNIRPETMSYFKQNDVGKTQLIYVVSGGIGDKIMFTRFIKNICDTQLPQNNIVLLVDVSLMWIYEYLYKSNSSILIVPFKQNINYFPKYDYHINATMLFDCLNLRYEDVYPDYYLKTIPTRRHKIINTVIDKNKKNVIINWGGSLVNIAETYNRKMSLELLIPLFAKCKHINWISVYKNATSDDKMLLKKYNVKYIGDDIDTHENSFEDTIALIRNVDLVITTDTALAHITGTMNHPCWCLLTKGCEWRWTLTDKTTCWYPEMKLIRQETAGIWDNVITNLLSLVQSL